MTTFKRIGGRYGFHSGSAKFKNLEVTSNMFLQGSVLGQGCQGTIYYVDKTRSASGDGKSWDNAFKTITLGIAALSDYDWLIIGPGNYDEASTITLTGKKGCKIFGYNTGMQWGEGSTNWRDVTSSKDLLNITGCQAIEIAGIGFVNSTAKDAINFTGLNYSVHIHDCNFTGDCGGGAIGVNAIDVAGSNGPDTYIHDCRFFRYATTAIIMGHQRCVIKDNIFVVPNAGKGISGLGSTAAYNSIIGNYFLGGGTDDYGIYSASDTAGLTIIADNRFANFDQTGQGEISVSVDQNCVNNIQFGSGGAITAVDPEA